MLKRRREPKMSAARKLLRQILMPMWYRKVLKIPTRNSSKSSNKRTPLLLRRRRRIQNKGKGKCYTCGVEGYYAAECDKSMYRPKKSAKLIETDGGTSEYGNLLPIVLSICHTHN